MDPRMVTTNEVDDEWKLIQIFIIDKSLFLIFLLLRLMVGCNLAGLV